MNENYNLREALSRKNKKSGKFKRGSRGKAY